LATHIFDAENPYLDSDVVFAVKPSLIRTLDPRQPDDGEAPDGADGTWYAVDDLDIVLVAEQVR
jgi:catechol 1,2-dioxygenase